MNVQITETETPKGIKAAHSCTACKGTGEIVRFYPKKKCIECGTIFVQRRRDAQTCSKRCSNIYQVRRSRERAKEREEAAEARKNKKAKPS